MKFYAIKCNGENRIVTDWIECQSYIKGKKDVKFKSFLSYEEALAFLSNEVIELNYELPTAFIDGSYDVKTGNYSFGGVLIIDQNVYQFNKKYLPDEYSSARNVAGEIKGAGFIINYAIKHGIKEINIFYDYEGIEKWYNGSWQAKTPIAQAYVQFRNSIKEKIKVNFIKVKSHSNNKYNDMADKLAKEVLGI